MNQKIIFISWTLFAKRTELLGRALDADIFYIGKVVKFEGMLWKLFSPVDYTIKTIKSLSILFKEKPTIVFVQNPPSIAPIVIVFFSKLLKFKTVIDSHNGAFQNPWVKVPFHNWALANAEIILVHNEILFERLKANNILFNNNFRILNDKLSEFNSNLKEISPQKYILVVSSFSPDEPMQMLLEGINIFSKFNNEIKFKITGDYKKNMDLYNKYSDNENINFVGFVGNNLYDYLVVNAYGIIALSTRDDVQQCALMEAVGAEIPFISSDNLANRTIFGKKMVLTKNSQISISQSISLFIKENEKLKKDILIIKKVLNEKWEMDLNNIKNEMF